MRDAADLALLVASGAIPSLAYLAVGLWLSRALRLDARGAERLALAFALGTGASSLAILALRALDVPLPLALWGVVALLGAPLLRDRVRAAGSGAFPRPSGVAVDAASLSVGAALFAAALAPETHWDGFEYHLPIAQAFAEGPIRALPGMLDAEFRTGVDLLYIPAVTAGAPDAAAAVSVGFALALAAMIRAEASRLAGSAAGRWAGFVSLLVPFTLDAAPSTYVDLAVGVYGFAALQYGNRWNAGGTARDLTLAAILAAFAANAKLHAAVLAPALGLLLLAGGRRPTASTLARCVVLGAVLAAPWLVKAAATTGNPFFPLFASVWGYGPSDAAHLAWKRADTYYYVQVERDLPGLLRYLGSLTFGRTYHVSGLLGPLPLALAPLAMGRLSRATATLIAVGVVLFLLQFVFMPALRFGTPLVPFVALAAAVGGARLAESGTAGRSVLVGALAISIGLGLHGLATQIAPRVAALGNPSDYEARTHPAQDALRRVVARGEAVVAIPRGAVSWMPKPVYNLHWSRNGELFFDGRTPADDALALLERRNVRSLVIDAAPDAAHGRVGHPIVDAWLASGQARLVPDPSPLAAQKGRVWRLVELP